MANTCAEFGGVCQDTGGIKLILWSEEAINFKLYVAEFFGSLLTQSCLSQLHSLTPLMICVATQARRSPYPSEDCEEQN